MRFSMAFMIGVSLASVAFLPTGAQQAKKPVAAKQPTPAPAAASQEDKETSRDKNSLVRFQGSWSGSCSTNEPGLVSFELIHGVTGELVDKNTLTLKFSRRLTRQRQYFPGGPVVPETVFRHSAFTLRFDDALKRYLLSFKGDEPVSFEDIPLTLSHEGQFSGEGSGTLREDPVKVQAKIELTENGGHTWKVTIYPVPVSDAQKQVAAPDSKPKASLTLAVSRSSESETKKE